MLLLMQAFDYRVGKRRL